MIRRCFKTRSSPRESRKLAKDVVEYLSTLIADGEALHDIDIMLTEACANVVRHAYGGQPGNLEVRLRVSPGAWVELQVVDWGSGFLDDVRFENPGPDSEGGRGMFIISMLSDSCEVREEGGENIISIHKDIGKQLWKS